MKRFICFVCVFVLFPFTVFSDENIYDPVGRWTIESNYTEMQFDYMFGKTDFYIFPNGSVYRVSITKNKNDKDLSIGYDSGIWLCDQSNIVLRVGKDTFKGVIDDDGFLVLYVSDSDIRFIRVCGE